MKHDIAHALWPSTTGCTCTMAQIKQCVLCGRTLRPDREHVDTCGKLCFREVAKMQIHVEDRELAEKVAAIQLTHAIVDEVIAEEVRDDSHGA